MIFVLPHHPFFKLQAYEHSIFFQALKPSPVCKQIAGTKTHQNQRNKSFEVLTPEDPNSFHRSELGNHVPTTRKCDFRRGIRCRCSREREGEWLRQEHALGLGVERAMDEFPGEGGGVTRYLTGPLHLIEII